MRVFDVFNGDADGIISLVQLRRRDPRPEAELVTGRKRDIELLDRVQTRSGDVVTVLDISMRSNAIHLERILKSGASVFYVDHHNPGDAISHPNLQAIINTAPEVCTAVLIDNCLKGRYRAWAVTAAFGDNFPAMARRLANGHNLPVDRLEQLGVLINYNGYGASVADLHFDPADLYRHLEPYDTPMDFLTDRPEIFAKLSDGYQADMALADNAEIIEESDRGLVLELPDQAASRRVSGVFGNKLAQDHPNRAHAVLTRSGGRYVVSVRAPLASRKGADELCLKFATGGGRAAAAGINALPFDQIEEFVDAFNGQFS